MSEKAQNLAKRIKILCEKGLVLFALNLSRACMRSVNTLSSTSELQYINYIMDVFTVLSCKFGYESDIIEMVSFN